MLNGSKDSKCVEDHQVDTHHCVRLFEFCVLEINLLFQLFLLSRSLPIVNCAHNKCGVCRGISSFIKFLQVPIPEFQYFYLVILFLVSVVNFPSCINQIFFQFY